MARKRKNVRKKTSEVRSGDTGDQSSAAPASAVSPPGGQALQSTPGEKPALNISSSRHFLSWLIGQGMSIGFTTHQASKLFFIGRMDEEEKLAVEERTIEKCTGISATGNSLYIASSYQIWRFENALPSGVSHGAYDRVYIPKSSHVTGDVNTHEMAIDGDGRLVFVNTLFSCLAYLSRDYSFFPIWQPDFITDLVAEDRCHLTGLAMVDGHPGYVTACGKSDEAKGWEEGRTEGGIVIDVRENQVVCSGLSMPHSPRWHDGKLWILNSGTGYLGYVDLAESSFVPVSFCPGYARGMATMGNFALISLSKAREPDGFSGLELESKLKETSAEPWCGILVVDLTTGNLLHWLRIDGVVDEIFDLVPMPGMARPRAVGFRNEEIYRTISLPPRDDD